VPHATARPRSSILLPTALLFAVALLAAGPSRAAETITWMPVQAGPVAKGGDIGPIEVLPYAEGRVLLRLSEVALMTAGIPTTIGPDYAFPGARLGLATIDRVLAEVGTNEVRRAYDLPANTARAEALGVHRWFIVDYAGDVSPIEMKARFAGMAEVEEVTPDWRAFTMAVPTDPMHAMHWGHNNTAQLLDYNWGNNNHETGSPVGTVGFDANAHDAWSGPAGFGSSSVIVAIMDTGVDAGHPDLLQMAGYDFGDNDANPDDDSAGQGHGTACSGVAAATMNNLGTAGIAAGCTIMPLKVADSGGSLFFTYIQNALYYAADNGADIVSMSFGAAIANDPATDTALQYAWDNGCVLLAATGNSNSSSISYPANHATVIGVGAASPCDGRKRSSSNTGELNPGVNPDPNGYSCDGERWWGSSYGVNTQDAAGAVDVIAPTILPTTDIQGAAGYDPTDYSKWFNGTSCATPYAAGVCALIKSANPAFTNAEIRDQLLQTAQDVVDVEAGPGWDRYSGYGMVDAYAAAASGPYPHPPANVAAVSTCLAPTDIALTWDDPTIRGDGTPLGDFEILVYRDGSPIGPVDQGIEMLTDTGLTVGQLYSYDLRTHDEDTDSLSLIVNILKYAGGDPTPSPPGGFSVTAIAGPAFDLDWTNPTTTLDGSPLCDFAGVNVYRNGSLLTTIPYGPGDIGIAGTHTDFAPLPGLNCYELTAFDSEIPSRESPLSNEICVEVPLNLPFSDCFEVAGPPDAALWTTDGVVVDNLAINPPTPPNAADFDGVDVLTSRAIDLSTAGGAGYVVLYQKEQTGGGESADAGNDFVVELQNSDGNWDEVGRHFGADPDEVNFTTHIVDLDAAVPSSGTFFHGQFRVRFRTTGDAGFDNWFLDCMTIEVPSCDATIGVDPLAVDDLLVAGTPLGDIDPIEVSNGCAFNALNWSAAENPDASWLTLAGASGSISGTGSQVFTATFNAIGMSPGVYNTDIDITSNDPANPVVTVTATLTVQAAPVLTLSTMSISNSVDELDPPVVDNVDVGNTGGGVLEFSAVDVSAGANLFAVAEVVSAKRADGAVLPMGKTPAPKPSLAKEVWYRAGLATNGARTAPGKEVEDSGSDRRFQPQPYASGGPDAAGYRFIDSDDPNGPEFAWFDISGVGSPSGVTGDDQNLGPYPLGFTFQHYGTNYTEIRICSNGFLSFGSTATPFTNLALPSASAPGNLVAPFWDDFNPGEAGTIYTYMDGSRFIVQWNDVPFYSLGGGADRCTFQAILHKDGTILFQYLDVGVPSNSATVGVQNLTGTVGLQAAFNQAYLHNGLAVLFYRDAPWLSVAPTSGTVAPSGTEPLAVTSDPTGLAIGTYFGNVLLFTNDPVNPVGRIAVELEVTGFVPPPDIEITPAELCTIVGHVDGPVVNEQVTVTNNSLATINWRLADTQGIPAAPGFRTSDAAVPNPKKLEIFAHLVGLDDSAIESGLEGNPEVKGAWESPLRGGIQPYGQGGPDAFGYRWIDSDEAGGPPFQWIEIDGNGGINTGLACDDCNLGPFPLGFDFPFYGTNYTGIRVASNGFLTFTGTTAPFTNPCPFPSTAVPNATIAPFFEDMNLAIGGQVLYRSEPAMGRFIVEYKNVNRYGAPGVPFTFQVVLCKDGSIQYNYLTMSGPVNSATVGIENAGGTGGLSIACNTNYIHNNLSVLIQNEQEWLSAAPASGSIAPGGSANIGVQLDPTGLALGLHKGFVRLQFDDPAQTVGIVPVCFEIEEPAIAVTLARFEALSTPDGVQVAWETSDETQHSHFDIYRSEGMGGAFAKVNPAPITGDGSYAFVDGGVTDGVEYRYRLEAVDRNGGRQSFGPIVITYAGRPATFQLVQNYPNPFRGHTTFQLALPAPAEVKLRVFNAMGRLVRTIEDGAMQPGRHTFEWNGRDDSGQQAAAGFYFLRAESTVGTMTVRMMLLK
jgi:subtilisin family serine protease